MNLQDTPRTNAALVDIQVAFESMGGLSSAPESWIDPDFARQLERELNAVKAELKSLKEWRTMDSAPKDGTKIFILESGEVHAAWWDSSFKISGSNDDRSFNYRGGWTDNTRTSFGREEFVEFIPSHWMPLPELPK